jgi:hypothetical protein
MNRSRPATSSQRLASEIQLARIRLAKAESSLDSAREQSRVAKRRRKEAKQAARRARKQVKEAKADLREAKQVLLAAEEKLALARQRAALARRRAKATEAAKATVAGPGQRKKAAPPRRSRLVVSAVTPAPGRAKKRQPKPGPVEPAFPIQQPAVPGANEPLTLPPDVETPPATTASLPETPAPAPETEI